MGGNDGRKLGWCVVVVEVDDDGSHVVYVVGTCKGSAVGMLVGNGVGPTRSTAGNFVGVTVGNRDGS